MMATVPHVTSGLGLGKFQADGFLLTRVYIHTTGMPCRSLRQDEVGSGQFLRNICKYTPNYTVSHLLSS